jgi:triosephosphate isomerase
MRKPIIAGNWKMNKTVDEAAEFLTALLPAIKDVNDVDVVFFTPYLDLAKAVKLTAGTNVEIGAQNMHQETSGAFTGEISGEMLQAIDVPYVLIGHSERRAYYNETDESVNEKTVKALALGLKPVVCCGETLEERESGIAEKIVVNQVKSGLKDIEDITKVVVAYEPIWAIGTGKTASAEDADEACGWVRSTIAEIYGSEAAEAVRIQYGGSVKPANVSELMAMENIDGGLVGGASLKLDFEKVIKY